MPYVYKITYPNGKIYIGSDPTDDINYFGSMTVKEPFATLEPGAVIPITKEILWYSGEASREETEEMESSLILMHRSKEPEIGYNLRLPRRTRHKSTLVIPPK